MYCDYEALKTYANELNKNFNTINKSLESFENALETTLSLNTWDSPTRDYYYDLYSSMKDNFSNITNKFSNINQYLDSVINNYMYLEQQMESLF